MWWERWIPKSVLNKSEVCAIECLFNEQDIRFSIIELKKEKTSVKIAQRFSYTNQADFLAYLKKKKSPISLVINGKGVITKKIKFSENDSLQINDLVKQHLPTINPTDFYVQFYKNTNNTGYLVICRKIQVDELLQVLKSEDKEIVSVFLGVMCCNGIANLTQTYNSIQTSTYQLQLNNGEIEVIETNENTEKQNTILGNLVLTPTELIPFSAGFCYLTQQDIYQTDNTELSELSVNHQQKNKLKTLLMVLLGILFLLSAINSIFFFKEFEKTQSLIRS